VHYVLLVEMGHSQTTVLLAAVNAEGHSILSEASDASFGAANFDARLFQHFGDEIGKKHGTTVKPGEEGGQERAWDDGHVIFTGPPG
jgi:molecular chaperone DnaK (HSP70)